MPKIAAMGRKNQPGLIVVDRTVTGPYENYTTPEQEVPAKPLDYPWETCMTMGNSWSYVPGDHYKSVHELVQLLVKVVSRGGNFLMNIGPGPDGDWDPEAYKRLQGIGAWMKINGEGIYNSRAVAPYSAGDIYYTKSKDKNTVYAFVLANQDAVALPSSLNIPLTGVKTVKKVSLLGGTQKLSWKSNAAGIQLTIPKSVQQLALKEAACFKIDY
jgi:alpha-L-fucosidase